MKKTAASSRSDRQSPVLRGVLPALCVVLAAFAFVSQPPRELLHGFWQILISDAGLITDPAVTGGAGAALLNAALVLALSTALVYAMHLPVTGLTFACLFMMAGFSLLGKNLLNILPVLLGGWLYAKFQGEPFSKYIYQTLFSTCLSPLVSFWLVHLPGWWCIPAMLFSGVAIGFFVPPIAGYTVKLHQGFDLYNVGFAAGFLGLGIASICKGLGVEFVTELQWGFEDHETFLWLLRVILLGLLLAGIYLGCRRPRDYTPLLRHSGRSVADFILMDGAAPTLVNMAFTGGIGLVYLLALYPFGVRLNGPLVCCVLSMTGFAAFGKHPKKYSSGDGRRVPCKGAACRRAVHRAGSAACRAVLHGACADCRSVRRFLGHGRRISAHDHRPEHLHSAWRHESLQQRLCRRIGLRAAASDH